MLPPPIHTGHALCTTASSQPMSGQIPEPPLRTTALLYTRGHICPHPTAGREARCRCMALSITSPLTVAWCLSTQMSTEMFLFPFQVLNYSVSFWKEMSRCKAHSSRTCPWVCKRPRKSAAKDNLLWHLSYTCGRRQGRCPQEADPLHANEKHLSGSFSHEYRYLYDEEVQNRCSSGSGFSPLMLEWS